MKTNLVVVRMAKNPAVRWSEPILIEHKLYIGRNRKLVVARLGFPRPVKDSDEWACSFQLTGGTVDRIYTAPGTDGMQALWIAAKTLRRWLDKKRRFMIESTPPYETIFPKFIPWDYGLDFHWRLCEFVDAEVEKKERHLSRRRLKREKRDKI